MKTINYKFGDNTEKRVKVADDFYEIYEAMEKESYSNERRETRRHVSLDYLSEFSIEPADESFNILDKLTKEEMFIRLDEAIKKLKPHQQTLIKRVFFNGEKLSDIAKEKGIGRSAMTQQMQLALAKLKNFLKNF